MLIFLNVRCMSHFTVETACKASNVQFMDGVFWSHQPRFMSVSSHFDKLGKITNVHSNMTWRQVSTNTQNLWCTVHTGIASLPISRLYDFVALDSTPMVYGFRASYQLFLSVLFFISGHIRYSITK